MAAVKYEINCVDPVALSVALRVDACLIRSCTKPFWRSLLDMLLLK